MEIQPFVVRDCALLVMRSNIPTAVNLRELRERIASCNLNVLYHHFCETTMIPQFDNPDYRNDFAVWVKQALGDRILAEQLGILDPYSFDTMEDLRKAVIDIIDDRLSVSSSTFSVPKGDEFYFNEAVTIVFDTGERINHPDELASAIERMSNGSIYFHFIEALRRDPIKMCDFSAWLTQCGDEWQSMCDILKSIDFYFYTLSDLRKELVHSLKADIA